LIEIGSKTAEENSAQTNKQTDRLYENNGHLAVNQLSELFCAVLRTTFNCRQWYAHTYEQFLPFSCVVCSCRVRFSLFSTKPSDWLGETYLWNYLLCAMMMVTVTQLNSTSMYGRRC